jgi:beta-lactamase regulating signal transducer with metallopeptidase domain
MLQILIITSLMTILLLLLTPVLNNKYSPLCVYILWICILLRFALPFAIHLPSFDIPFLNYSASIEKFNTPMDKLNKTSTGEISKEEKVPFTLDASNLQTTSSQDTQTPSKFNDVNLNKLSLKYILSSLWIFVASCLCIYFLLNYINFSNKIKKHSVSIKDSETLNTFEQLKTEMNIKRNIEIKVYKNTYTPQLFGFFKPLLLLPTVSYTTEELRLILKHELTHYKHKDLSIKFLTLIINIIFWFDPFIYVIKKNLEIYCELCCDEAVVKNMNASDKQKYCQCILTLIKASIREKSNFSTCFYQNKIILKRRIYSMVSSTKKSKGISIIIISIFLMGIVSGCADIASSSSVKTSINPTNLSTANESDLSMIAFIADKNLSIAYLNSTEAPIKIDTDGTFSRPLISKDKNNIAYLKDDNLYIHFKTGEIKKIADAVPDLSFTWLNNDFIAYSPSSGGIYVFDVSKKLSTPYIEDEFNYQNITMAKDNKFFAEKYRITGKDNDLHREDFGIALIDSKNQVNKIVIASIPSVTDGKTIESLGMYPVIANISKDLDYLYIWEHPHAGSLAADGMDMAVYDLNTDKYTRYSSDDIFVLGYKANIVPSPTDNNSVAIINGGDRIMSHDKKLTLLNPSTSKFQDVSPKGEAVMTPSFSKDGKSLLFAAAPELDVKTKQATMFKASHYIYNINMETNEITQLTNTENKFDFSPMFINNKDIVFFRNDLDKNVSLWKIQDGIETKLVDSLNIANYYGQFRSELVLDIK